MTQDLIEKENHGQSVILKGQLHRKLPDRQTPGNWMERANRKMLEYNWRYSQKAKNQRTGWAGRQNAEKETP